MAIYQSSGIVRTPYPRGSGVYSVRTSAVLSLASTVTVNNGDALQLCYIPFGSYISSFFLVTSAAIDGSGNTLSLKLQDSLASPTVYIATGTGWNAALTGSTAKTITGFAQSTIGTMYGTTARSIGTSGPQVVVWTSGVVLELLATANAAGATGGTVNINFQVEFSPNYDMGS